jgi:phosphotransferase system enzyme I (PtsP)
MIRSIEAEAVRAKVEQLLAKPPASMRKSLGDWAKKQGIALG